MRRRLSPNPFQVGDRVVIRKGTLHGLVGQVISRESSRVLISVDCGAAGVLVRLSHRSVSSLPRDDRSESNSALE